jgi:predicted metalloprotease with PDZ domain
VHASLLLFFLDFTAQAAPPPPPPEPVSVSIRDEHLRGATSVGDGLQCGGEWYDGLGILIKPMLGEVTSIGPGTPAAAAGLRAGDVIINSEILGINRYTVGTVLKLRVMRDGREIQIDLVIGKVCNE